MLHVTLEGIVVRIKINLMTNITITKSLCTKIKNENTNTCTVPVTNTTQSYSSNPTHRVCIIDHFKSTNDKVTMQ